MGDVCRGDLAGEDQLIHHVVEPAHAGIVALMLLAQLALMRRFLQRPSERAVWYSGFGVLLYVLGMLASAFALRAGGVQGGTL